MISYWERESLMQWDTIIVGGGLLGMWTAYHLLKEDPQKKVLILERGLFSSGASTKNAGIACFGSLTEILDDIKIIGVEQTVKQVIQRKNGLQMIRDVFGQQADFKLNGGYELLNIKNEGCLSELENINLILRPHFNDQDVFEVRDELIKEFGFGPGVTHLIYNKFEGSIDTGKYILSLTQLLGQMGAQITTGAEVINVTDKGIVEVRNCIQENAPFYQYKARKIAVCTNSFISKLLPETRFKDYEPGRGQILITHQLPLKFEGTFSFDDGYFYFRTINGRLLFGGGRNLDAKVETTSSFENTSIIKEKLEYYLKTLILPGQKFDIDICWSGIMGFWRDSHEKKYIFEEVRPNVFAGISCCGMGVALTNQSGKQLAILISSNFQSKL